MKKFDNFAANLSVLSRAGQQDLANEFVMSGIIDKFFIQFELGWKVLKGLLRYEGSSAAASGSPREIIKKAYTVYDFIDEDVWCGMLKDRSDLTHMYDAGAAQRLMEKILSIYIPEFQKMEAEILRQYGDVLDRL